MKEITIENIAVTGGFVLYMIAGISYYTKGNYPWALTWLSYAVANVGLIWASLKN